MSAEPDYLPADALAEEEPKYLRRQKPVEIRKRKFSRKAWPLYRRVATAMVVALLAGWVLYHAGRYFLYAPAMLLRSADQIEIEGGRFVSRQAVVEKFSADMGRSVIRIPLDQRRNDIESLAWIERASVHRVLPGRIRVDVTERTPIAFLRSSGELFLLDVQGTILERPVEGEFRFPVVSGIGEATPRDVRAQRAELFVQFMKDIEWVRPGAGDHVSEVDLSDPSDLRATLTSLGPGEHPEPVLVHFGSSEFGTRYRLLVENIGQWRATAGRVDSVDLRFARQVVVNPESKIAASGRR